MEFKPCSPGAEEDDQVHRCEAQGNQGERFTLTKETEFLVVEKLTLLIIFIAMAQPVDSRHPGAPHVMCHETIIHVTHCICTVYCNAQQQCKSFTVNRCEVENGPNRWNRLEYRSGLDGSDHRLTTHCSQPSMLHSV